MACGHSERHNRSQSMLEFTRCQEVTVGKDRTPAIRRHALCSASPLSPLQVSISVTLCVCRSEEEGRTNASSNRCAGDIGFGRFSRYLNVCRAW